MKAAVAGAGTWGKNIVRTLHEMGALEAVADVSPALRAGLADAYPGLTIYDDPAAIGSSDVPAAVVATPAATHYAVTKTLLEAGKDVMVEKPMTLSVAEAEDLVATAETLGRVLMVGHLLLYQPALQWLKGALDSGTIGKIRGIHQKRLSLGKARNVENVLWSLGVHDVAVALYLVGTAPEEVQIGGQRMLQPTIEDDVHLRMIFPGGVETYIHCSWLWPERERGTVVVGTDGMFVYNEPEQTVTLHRKSIDASLQNVDNGSEVVYQATGELLRLELQHFLDCVRDRKTPISDGRSGVEVIRVLEKASEGLGR